MNTAKTVALMVTLLLATILVSCAKEAEPDKAVAPSETEMLLQWMTGSFSSAKQAESDQAFFDIRLEMAPIWPELSDAHYLYVEQAVASSLDSPYRQRVYRVSQVDDSTWESAVYTMAEPLRFAGDWRKDIPLAGLTPDSLSLREGCAIYLHRDSSGAFAGQTDGQECASTLRGATYATSEVVITENYLYSWDRGFDARDEQVWGAETGGYIFKRVTGDAE